MALQLGALRTALIDAGASVAAAEEVAMDESKLASLDLKVAVVMLMLTGLYALVVPGVYMLFRIGMKTGSFN